MVIDLSGAATLLLRSRYDLGQKMTAIDAMNGFIKCFLQAKGVIFIGNIVNAETPNGPSMTLRLIFHIHLSSSLRGNRGLHCEW